MISASSTITPTFKIESANNDYWRFSMTATDTGNNTSLEFSIYGTLSSDGTSVSPGAGSLRTIWGAQLVKGDQTKNYLPTTDRVNLPRLNYPVYGDCPSLLVEPQITNLITYSQNFTQWNTASTTLTANQITSPDGTTTGSLVQSTGTGTSLIEPSGLSLTIGVTYTYSVFVKKGNNQWIRLAHISSSVTGCWFDLDNGSIGTVNSENATIEEYKNGWYRITNTFVATSTATGNSAFIGICDNNGSTNAGVIGQNVYIYGAQLEVGSYATSLIHTSGSTVTRNEDKALYAGLGTTDTFNDDEGVLFIETEIN